MPYTVNFDQIFKEDSTEVESVRFSCPRERGGLANNDGPYYGTELIQKAKSIMARGLQPEVGQLEGDVIEEIKALYASQRDRKSENHGLVNLLDQLRHAADENQTIKGLKNPRNIDVYVSQGGASDYDRTYPKDKIQTIAVPVWLGNVLKAASKQVHEEREEASFQKRMNWVGGLTVTAAVGGLATFAVPMILVAMSPEGLKAVGDLFTQGNPYVYAGLALLVLGIVVASIAFSKSKACKDKKAVSSVFQANASTRNAGSDVKATQGDKL